MVLAAIANGQVKVNGEQKLLFEIYCYEMNKPIYRIKSPTELRNAAKYLAVNKLEIVGFVGQQIFVRRCYSRRSLKPETDERAYDGPIRSSELREVFAESR